MSQVTCPCCRRPLPVSDDLVVDGSGMLVRFGQVASLTQREFALFEVMHERPGVTFTKEQLLSAVYWNTRGDEVEIKIIDVFICKIRKKVQPLGIEIQTLWGAGYRLVPLEKRRQAA